LDYNLVQKVALDPYKRRDRQQTDLSFEEKTGSICWPQLLLVGDRFVNRKIQMKRKKENGKARKSIEHA
jgi:hypothetical protein